MGFCCIVSIGLEWEVFISCFFFFFFLFLVEWGSCTCSVASLPTLSYPTLPCISSGCHFLQEILSSCSQQSFPKILSKSRVWFRGSSEDLSLWCWTLMCPGKGQFDSYLEGFLEKFVVDQLCLSLCDPMDCNTPGFPVHHQLPELGQAHVHWVSDAIPPSCPLSSPSPPAFNLSQCQGLF